MANVHSIMSRPFVRVLLLTLNLAALPGLHAQEPAAPAGPALTLEECIARALEKNFALKIQGFSTTIAQESLNVAKAGFEPTLTASTLHSVSQTGLVTGVGPRYDTTDTRLGITQTLTTGANVSLSTSLDRSGTNPALTTPNPAFNSDLSLSITQPLLKGAGTVVNRATIERNQLGLTIANLSYKSSVLLVIRNTEVAYFNLVFAREQMTVKQHSLELAVKLYEENKVRKTTGVATDLDVLTAEVGVANARNGVVTADQLVRNSEDALLALIGRMEFNSPVGPVSLPGGHEAPPSFDVSYKLALDNQPDLISSQTAIKQFELDAHTAKNGALPTLNLGGTLGYNGTNRSYGTAVNRLSDGDGHNWQLDLSLNLPWGLHADRARYRSALAGLRQEQARLQQVEQDLIVKVRSAVRAVETNQQSVEIFGKSTELAEKQYELQLARFKAGLATSRQVLEVQDDLESARVNELQARVNLRTANANLHQLESSSLERYHIALAQ